MLGFIYVALGCAVAVYAFLAGDYRPWLPVGLGLIVCGVILLLGTPRPHRRPRMTVARRARLFDLLQGVREAEGVIADRMTRGLITPDDMIEQVWTVREQEIAIMRELGWRHRADARQEDLDMRRSWGTL
jgi:hypothetical protein